VNVHAGKAHFNRESFEALVATLRMAAAFERFDDPVMTVEEFASERARQSALADGLISAAKAAGYQVEALCNGAAAE
jgi:hypothetical protein